MIEDNQPQNAFRGSRMSHSRNISKLDMSKSRMTWKPMLEDMPPMIQVEGVSERKSLLNSRSAINKMQPNNEYMDFPEDSNLMLKESNIKLQDSNLLDLGLSQLKSNDNLLSDLGMFSNHSRNNGLPNDEIQNSYYRKQDS